MPSPPGSHLLPLQASDPHLPAVSVGGHRGPIHALLLLQPLQGARQTKGRSVEVLAPRLKRKQERAGRSQVVHPGGETAAAQGQGVLYPPEGS